MSFWSDPIAFLGKWLIDILALLNLPPELINFISTLAGVVIVASFGLVGVIFLIWAVVPVASGWIGTDLNVGVLYVAAVGSFGILSIIMAGWSSNNKYALLGAFRAVAQLISYEVPM